MIELYVIGGLFAILSVGISFMLRSKFNKYSKIRLQKDLSGAAIAAKMLEQHGIHDVKITCVQGKLTDHYNPANKTVNLSEAVYHGRNAAAVAVATHECGHAVQHAKAYGFLRFRSAMVPLLSVSSRYMMWVVLIGIFLVNTTIIPLTIGIALFGLTTLFSFITLPVEFDASRRALAWIQNNGVATTQEYAMAKDALRWAAMTYVVAALGSLAQLLYLIFILMGRRD